MEVTVNLAIIGLDFMSGEYFVLHVDNFLPSIEVEECVDLNIQDFAVALSKNCVDLSTNWLNFKIVNSYFNNDGKLCIDYGTTVPLDSKVIEPFSWINTKLIELDDNNLVMTIENTVTGIN